MLTTNELKDNISNEISKIEDIIDVSGIKFRKMINTANEDLFVAGIDSLRDMDLSSIEEKEKKDIRDRGALLITESRPPAKKVLEMFLLKIS